MRLLWNTLQNRNWQKLDINFEKDAEIDIVTFFTDGEKVNVVFCESKVLQNSDESDSVLCAIK